uniref:Uncharacterized protein n=1 Tax=Panagrolaimus sp. ES5 TaxID=591445 RepID=A0AC34GQF0_9BILA
MKLKKERQVKHQKINIKEKRDDIPNCPSLETVEYYNFLDDDGATSDVSDLLIGDPDEEESKNIQKAKEEIANQLFECQRKKDLEELYGIIDSTSSSDEEGDGKKDARANDFKHLNDPVYPYNQFEAYRRFDPPSEEQYYDPEREAAERERAERRKQQAQEFFDNLLYASLSLGKQSAYLFGKMINYSAKYPTPAGIALIIFGLYFTIMYLELSAAAFAEWCIQWFWPTTRLFIRCSERFLRKMAGFLNELDDLGQSTYCDMATLWCERYSMLCEYRCSFVDMAWERTRQ